MILEISYQWFQYVCTSSFKGFYQRFIKVLPMVFEYDNNDFVVLSPMICTNDVVIRLPTIFRDFYQRILRHCYNDFRNFVPMVLVCLYQQF